MRADGFSKTYDPKDPVPFAALIQEGIFKVIKCFNDQ
jgi:hypothetical protein